MQSKLPWFKLYSDIITDPKIRRLTVDERWFWIVLLCLAAENNRRGQVTLVTDKVSFSVTDFVQVCGYDHSDEIYGEISPQEMISGAIKKFVELHMIDIDATGIITIKNFEKRQDIYLEPAERMKKYRAKKKVTSVTQAHVTNLNNRDARVEEIREEKSRGDKIREEKSREENTPLPPKGGKSGLVQNGFETFWKLYPKRKARRHAEKAWNKLAPNEQLQSQILAAIELAKTSEQWAKDNGRYIPHPATWLNADGWLDEDEVVVSRVPSNMRGLEAWVKERGVT